MSDKKKGFTVGTMQVSITPIHSGCTYILPSFLAEAAKKYPSSPKWMRERTHGCWCSSWKLLGETDWRVWRKGRWLRPKQQEIRMKWVIVEDGDMLPISQKKADELRKKAEDAI